ncbi:hypothetical protein BOTBODRAFT_49876 [Botryobasidium botryosum FD-172 SS1]|uniref:CAP-Gly domain-containing protein n=1 Tax=Botryobasidium botryosum (strain FD-172 SS1) TaxID=930990 RepID=A0A067MZL0_BOTB1|nr:hypothetical protein BOTBODRAFT_49876 [Botryobasidium botryosum FD-172 SS1]
MSIQGGAVTPGRAGPRVSGIPTPGARTSGIPTPGRPRSSAGGHSAASDDADAMSRALSDAIRANNPSQHRFGDASDPFTHSPSGSSGGKPVRPTVHTAYSLGPGPAYRVPDPLSSSRGPGAFRSKTPTSTSGHRQPRTSLAQSTHTRPSSRQSGSRYSTSSNRPESRASDARSSSRLGNIKTGWELGDKVRIESLGMEGTLRFLGEADFKPGHWAGVELSGGFAGKGKNNGTVGGIQYFSCPDKCGVFVATSKLSLPIARPPSVASSRGGRVTPALSGRVTPSSFVTPGPPSRALPESKITDGSRASKYVGLTARQLNSRGAADLHAGSQSPTRSASSMITPKPPARATSGIITPKGRASLGASIGTTPKANGRPHYGISPLPEVPPLPSPPSLSRIGVKGASLTQMNLDELNNERRNSGDDIKSLQMNGKAIQDKITRLMNGTTSSTSSTNSMPPPPPPPFANGTSHHINGDSLQSRIDELERENRRLRMEAEAAALISPAGDDQTAQVTQLQARVDELETVKAELESKLETAEVPVGPSEEAIAKLEQTEREKAEALARVSELEGQLKTSERSVKERQDKVEAAERAAQAASDAADKARTETETKLKDALAQLADSEALVGSLKEAIATASEDGSAALVAKKKEVALLEAKVARATAELEEERRELGAQIDELRQAGQQTIALYEERMSDSESRRYDLEDLVRSLEEQLKKHAEPLSPATRAQQLSTAAQIDNENLREQISHLQKNISNLQDQLEDAQAMQERDEAAIKARMTRFKENETLLKNEVTEARLEVERLIKAEEGARTRVDELMEALSENAVALENARAEIEGLRTELNGLEGLQEAALGDSDGLDGVAKRAFGEKARLAEEVSRLQELLDTARNAKRQATDQYEAAAREAEAALRQVEELRTVLDATEEEKAELQRLAQEQQAKFANERKISHGLRQLLDERADEFDSPRRNGSFEQLSPSTLNGPRRDSVASNSSRLSRVSNGKDENSTLQITGLKHIIQELTKENMMLTSQVKMLESENKMLLSEMEELRETMKVLEASVEEQLLREEHALDAELSSLGQTDDAAQVQRILQETRSKLEAEIEQLRRKMSEMETKNNRIVHDLNKEIAEMENLVEAKDELEREIERLKKASRTHKASNKMSGESLLTGNNAIRRASIPESEDGEVCEICGKAGHDILTCDLVFNDSVPIASKVVSDMWCVDCESPTHSTEHCPHSQDVF